MEEAIRAMDTMPDNPIERGRRLAQIANRLELGKDMAKRYGLGRRAKRRGG